MACSRLLRCIAVGVVCAPGAHAQSGTTGYPEKPIRMVVPFATGGALDVVGRIVAQKMTETWGKAVIIDNRLGAGGNIGAEYVARSAPDGYTLLVSSVTTQAINMSLQSKPGYDFERDYAPASMIANAPLALMIHPALPVKTVREFIVLAKARPGELNYFSSGVGTGTHLAAAILDQRAGIRTTHVPYKGGGQGVNDLLSGQVQFAFSTLQLALPHVESKRLRLLGIGSLERYPRLPDLPTLAESGVKGYEAVQWYGVVAPAGTPRAIVDKLAAGLQAIVTNDGVRERFYSLGIVPVGSTPEAFAADIKANIAKYRKLIASLGIKVE